MQINVWKETIMILNAIKCKDIIMEISENDKKIILKNSNEIFEAVYDDKKESFFIKLNEDIIIEHQYQDRFLEIFRDTNFYECKCKTK